MSKELGSPSGATSEVMQGAMGRRIGPIPRARMVGATAVTVSWIAVLPRLSGDAHRRRIGAHLWRTASDNARPDLAMRLAASAGAPPAEVGRMDKSLVVDAWCISGSSCSSSFGSGSGDATLAAQRTAVRSRGVLVIVGAAMRTTLRCNPRSR